VHRNDSLFDSTRCNAICDAPIGARPVTHILSKITQAAPSLLESSFIRCLQRQFDRHDLYDHHTFIHNRSLGAHCQRVDLYGLWIELCVLADVDTFGVCISVGSSVSKAGFGYASRSSCSSCFFQIQFWPFVYVVGSVGGYISRSKKICTQTLSRRRLSEIDKNLQNLEQ
jgi:hypothetical protein